MTVSSYATNTLSTTGSSTEDFLSSPNVVGKFKLFVDTNDMASGDVIEIRVYKMVRASGTQRVLYYMRYEGLQPTDDLIKVSPEVWNDLTDANAVRFSITQVAGTAGISLPWNVLKDDDSAAAVWATAMSDLTAVPASTASVLAAINWMYELSRNKLTQTATTGTLKKDDGSTTVGTTTVSDDLTTFTRGKWA